VFPPEPDRVPPGDVGAVPFDADVLFDLLQSARETDLLAGVHEVQMRALEVDVEVRLEEGDVEALAVERDQQIGVGKGRPEVPGGEVVAGDERLRLAGLVQRDGRHLIAVFVQASGLDVEETRAVGEGLVEAPLLAAGETAVEVGHVSGVEILAALVDELADAVAAFAADDARFELVPVGHPLLPDGPLCLLADTVDPDETVLDAHAHR